uniref:Uncharacterized protein n=1 Tax=Octactis speculum TaxID=3111310 RepID=A0A7S2MQC7_9STRA|mmetsp:Transcript_8178/g.10305  ORF Transcript_8178/g.10305 Transcript_8178/m.10305 type:complete len:318 (+) Transcript_8178:68-1021(+)
MASEKTKKLCWAWSSILGLAGFIVMMIFGCIYWQWESISEIEDTANKNWVEGTCKVKSRELIEVRIGAADDRRRLKEVYDLYRSHRRMRSTARSDGTAVYNVKLKIKRVSEVGVVGNATLVDLDPEEGTTAWEYPYMESGNAKAHWYTTYTRDDAVAIKHKYDVGEIYKCYWNPSATSEVSMTNSGGDWIEEKYVNPGKWMVSAAIILACLPCLWCCFAMATTEVKENEDPDEAVSIEAVSTTKEAPELLENGLAKPHDWPAQGDEMFATLKARFHRLPVEDIIAALVTTGYHGGKAARILTAAEKSDCDEGPLVQN